MTGLWVILALVVLLLVAFIASYNRFVRQRNLVQESWRQIDVELRRRHDLIPNLVETVRGYATQERTVLEAVTEARASAVQTMQASSSGVTAQAQVETQLGRALGNLFAVAENYPDLKSSQNFLALQQQLAETEDRIAAGRRFYNNNVRALNTRVEAFPSSIVAGMFHFAKADYFEVEDPEVRASRPSMVAGFSPFARPDTSGFEPRGVPPRFSVFSSPRGAPPAKPTPPPAPPAPPAPAAQPPQTGQQPG